MAEVVDLSDYTRYEDSFRERNSVMAAYVMTAAYHAAPPDFAEKVQFCAYRANNLGKWPGGAPITEDQSIALASASVLSQMITAYDEGKHLKLKPWVEDQMQVYQRTLGVIHEVGLFFAQDVFDTDITRHTAAALWDKVEAPNQAAQIAVDIWKTRGDVYMAPQEFMGLPDVAGVKLPESSTEEIPIPFYLTFHEPLHATWWLDSILDDVLAIHERAGPVESRMPGEQS